MYMVQTYHDYFKRTKQNLYGSKKTNLPEPELYMIYIGEKGNKKEVKFKTSRELRQDAYLMLEIRTFGVHSWKEIKYNELPDKVKVNYTM